jgi:hypothetical protein
MTKTKRLAIAKVLRAAKLELWDGKRNTSKSRFICWAIDHVYASDYTKQDAIGIVHSRLFPHNTLEDWIIGYHPHLDTSIKVMMQRTRHAWLDSMIEEFEA